MKQHELSPNSGSRRNRKRIGRGNGSGHGTYSGRGCKGQKSRSGGGPRLGFEGGQLPIVKRLPEKRGFVNIFKKQYHIVNIDSMDSFPANSEITPDELLKAGLVDNLKRPIKVLGNGDIDRPLLVRAHRFSVSAKKKITEAGGQVERC
ncbi:50S ribosomal protein L15 [Chloroflexota bacterium]